MTQVYEAIYENGVFRPIDKIILEEGRLVRLVVESEDDEFAREMEEAARDALFMQDLEECMSDFAAVDAETARLMAQDKEFDAES